jgi:hypothetical protein
MHPLDRSFDQGDAAEAQQRLRAAGRQETHALGPTGRKDHGTTRSKICAVIGNRAYADRRCILEFHDPFLRPFIARRA